MSVLFLLLFSFVSFYFFFFLFFYTATCHQQITALESSSLSTFPWGALLLASQSWKLLKLRRNSRKEESYYPQQFPTTPGNGSFMRSPAHGSPSEPRRGLGNPRACLAFSFWRSSHVCRMKVDPCETAAAFYTCSACRSAATQCRMDKSHPRRALVSNLCQRIVDGSLIPPPRSSLRCSKEFQF